MPPEIIEFWNHRDKLTVTDGLILKRNKIVIPTALTHLILERIHIGHMGVEKCVHRARDVLFWPRMSSDLSNMVLNCSICLECRNANAKEPLEPQKISQYPWQVVATDLFCWNSADYIVIVDYYSLFFEVHKLGSTNSQSVINKLKGTFSRQGIPEILVSNNAQYSSQQFSNFAKKIGFQTYYFQPTLPTIQRVSLKDGSNHKAYIQ